MPTCHTHHSLGPNYRSTLRAFPSLHLPFSAPSPVLPLHVTSLKRIRKARAGSLTNATASRDRFSHSATQRSLESWVGSHVLRSFAFFSLSSTPFTGLIGNGNCNPALGPCALEQSTRDGEGRSEDACPAG
ncbi:hypothetical protein PMIN04_006405 [Paraphaeosphaeria minitans]